MGGWVCMRARVHVCVVYVFCVFVCVCGHDNNVSVSCAPVSACAWHV